jgi:hypothetical protein
MMRKLSKWTVFLAVVALAVPAFADTLILKDGSRVSGYYEGGSARVVKFRANDGTARDYDILNVQQIQFGDTATAATTTSKPATNLTTPPGTSNSATSTATTNPSLRPAADRGSLASGSAANTAFTLPTGSKISIQMIDSVDSEVQKVGETFVAVLDQPLMSGGVEVVPKGADVRGRISNINEAGRVAERRAAWSGTYPDYCEWHPLFGDYIRVCRSR